MNKILEQIKTRKIYEYIMISTVIIFAMVVRLYKINNPLADWHSWRQADTASVTRTYVEKGINVWYPKYQDISSIQTGIFNPKGLRLVEFPIYNIIHALLVKNIPRFSLELWGRLLSSVSALFSAVFIYLIGKKLYGKWVGLWAAFFFSFIPYNIYFTRVILPEPMAVAFVLGSIWLFLKYLGNEKKTVLFLSAIFFALSTLIKPFAFFYAIAIFYLMVNRYGFANLFRKKELLLFWDIAIIPFFLWRIWINQHPEGIPHFSWAFNGDSIRFRPAFWYWIFAERFGKLILGVWGLIPFCLGLLNWPKKNLFSHMLFLGALCYVFIFATASVRHDYYQVFVIPAFCLILARGVTYGWSMVVEGFKPLLTRSLIIFSCFVMLIVGAFQVKEFYRINHSEIIEAGEALDKIAPKEALVIAPYNGDTAFLYQTKRWGWPAVEESFDQVIAKGASFFVTVNFADPDTKYVSEHYRVLVNNGRYLIADLRQRVN